MKEDQVGGFLEFSRMVAPYVMLPVLLVWTANVPRGCRRTCIVAAHACDVKSDYTTRGHDMTREHEMKVDVSVLLRENARLRADLRANERAIAAAPIALAMDVIDLKHETAELKRSADQLKSALRVASSTYVGMPFTHSLAQCIAHAKTAALAASDGVGLFLLLWRERVSKARARLAMSLLVWRVRVKMQIGRQLKQWSETKAA